MIQLTQIKHIDFPKITLGYKDYNGTQSGDFSINMDFLLKKFEGTGGKESEITTPSYFNTAYIDPELHCLMRPNGYDLCPDTLYIRAKEQENG